MKQYNLGPNGAIMTSLNLFTTRFDQVMGLLEKRKNEIKYSIYFVSNQGYSRIEIKYSIHFVSNESPNRSGPVRN